MGGLVIIDGLLQESAEEVVPASADQVSTEQFEVVLCLNYGLVDHVQLLIVNFDALQHLRQLLIGHQLFCLPMHQLQLAQKLCIPLQLPKISIERFEVCIVFRAVEETDAISPALVFSV